MAKTSPPDPFEPDPFVRLLHQWGDQRYKVVCSRLAAFSKSAAAGTITPETAQDRAMELLLGHYGCDPDMAERLWLAAG